MSHALLTTDRLLLRPLRSDDLAGYVELNADPEVRRYLGGTLTPQQSEAEFDAIAASFALRGLGMVAIDRRSDGAFVGTCGLTIEAWFPDDLELGWRLHRRFWGQGYATEAARAWRDHAFTARAAERLIAVSDTPNARSHRVMERLGMRYERTVELNAGAEVFEAKVYGLERAHWRKLPPGG